MSSRQSTAVGFDIIRDLFDLTGRTAVVIGGTSGIGARGALTLARAGARVCVAGRDARRADEVVGQILAEGGHAVAEQVDITSESSVHSLVERVEERLGQAEILINSAGIFHMKPTFDLSLAEWEEMVSVNLTGTFLACQAFGRAMCANGYGRIINLASTDAQVGVSEEAAYCASKGGVLQLTRALAAEWSSSGVRVNALGPTDFETPLTSAVLSDPDYLEWAKAVIPVGRPGQVHELDAAMLLLASAKGAEMIAGHCLMVDGGRTAI
ncbi:SDR family NAD(P)-dependent oxidoreductase [Leucobacter sp. Z1108]|uniref:SDR family NAD(P)-dependent oxidoreductase n=1 Tax=Leucobacter sp. Z1108 TaxID=3439066 RepID=UPI003F3375A5